MDPVTQAPSIFQALEPFLAVVGPGAPAAALIVCGYMMARRPSTELLWLRDLVDRLTPKP